MSKHESIKQTKNQIAAILDSPKQIDILQKKIDSTREEISELELNLNLITKKDFYRELLEKHKALDIEILKTRSTISELEREVQNWRFGYKDIHYQHGIRKHVYNLYLKQNSLIIERNNILAQSEYNVYLREFLPKIETLKNQLTHYESEINFIGSFENWVQLFSLTTLRINGETSEVILTLNEMKWDDNYYNLISMDNLLGQRLLGSKVGETFEITLFRPKRKLEVEILATTIPQRHILKSLINAKIIEFEHISQSKILENYNLLLKKHRKRYRPKIEIPQNSGDGRWRDAMRDIIVTYEVLTDLPLIDDDVFENSEAND